MSETAHRLDGISDTTANCICGWVGEVDGEQVPPHEAWTVLTQMYEGHRVPPTTLPTPEMYQAGLDALLHRLTWPSLHWGTEEVHRDAWPHVVHAVLDGALNPKEKS